MAGEWPTLSLREANVALIDCDHRTPPAVEAGYPYVTIPQLRNGRIDLSDVRRITHECFIEWTRKAKPSVNDVVLSRRCNPGETAFVPDGLEFALGQNLVLLRADGTKVYPPFLRWLVRGPHWWEQIGKFLNVGAVFDSLKCADVPNFRLRIPPMQQQRAIAHILGTLDDKIELNRRMNETLEGMARALFQSWFVDFDPVRAKAEGRDPSLPKPIADLFPDSFEDSELGEIPKGWRVGFLADCCERVQNGGTPRKDQPLFWTNGTIPWLTSGEVRQSIVIETQNFVTSEGLARSSAKILPAMTTVVALYGATAGQVCLLAAEMCTNQACTGLIPKPSFGPYVYLHTSSHVADLENQARGSAQQNLSQEIVSRLPTIIPDGRVLSAFEEITEFLFHKWILGLHESRTLAALRDTLLPKLISGELRVKDAERFVGRSVS